MKNLYITLILSLIAQILWSQDYKGKFLFENKKIKVENDSLFLYFNIRIKGEAVPSCTSMNIIPELTSKDGISYQLPYLQINGKSRARTYKRWVVLHNKKQVYPEPYMQVNILPKTDTVLTYNMQVPYQPWMDKAELYIHQEIWRCAGEHQLYTFEITDKLLQDTIRYEAGPQSDNIPPTLIQKEFSINGQILFEQSSGTPNSYELARLKQILSRITNKDTEVIDLKIKGYASPEGEYFFNEHLAQQRATSLKKHIINICNLSLFKVNLEMKWIAEDWDVLSSLVQNSALLQTGAILSIIENVENPEQRKIQLKQLANGIPYKTMYTNMFPLLRRAEYQINFRVRDTQP